MDSTEPHRTRWPSGTTLEDDGTIVFRPSWANYRAKVLSVPAFVVALVVVALLRLDGLLELVLVIGGTLAVTVAALGLYFSRGMTSVGPRGLARRIVFRTKQVPQERLGDVILIRQLESYDPRMDTSLIVTDTGGRKVAVFTGPFWSPDQLTAMAAALGRPTWAPEGPVSFRQVRERYPRAVPLFYARPFAFAFAVVLGAFAAVAAVAVVITVLTG